MTNKKHDSTLKELKKHKLDPDKMTLDRLVQYLPARFGVSYRWAAIPVFNGWGVAVYREVTNKNFLARQFITSSNKSTCALQESIAQMILWAMQNDLITYHQLIEFI